MILANFGRFCKILLPLFIRRKLGTSKIDCGDNRLYVGTLVRYAMIISVLKLTQVIKLNTADFLRIQKTQQENTKEDTKRATAINWD